MSIYDGFREAIESGGGTLTLSEDGSFAETPDVAVVVFGENPYAEFQGDRPTVDYVSDDGLAILKKLQEAGIPTVSVFISGRALWVNPEINASMAFVAAWLPGTEGGGIADVLVGNADGGPRYDFEGQLSFSWPRTADQVDVNIGDAVYSPLFPYGHRLTYSDDGALAQLSEESGLGDVVATSTGTFIEYGDPAGDWSMVLRDGSGDTRIGNSRGSSAGRNLSVAPADDVTQEDTIILTWTDSASLVIEGPPVDFVRETNGDMAIELKYRVLQANAVSVTVQMGRGVDWRGTINVTDAVVERAGAGWHTSLIKLSCFADQGLQMASITEPVVIEVDGSMTLQIAWARIAANPGGAGCGL